MKKRNIAYIMIEKISIILILLYPIMIILMMLGNIPGISIIENGYNEVRDYVSFRMTHLAMDGVNPYSLDVLESTNVPFMLLYTGLNPLLVAVLCRVTGISVMAGYYIVNIAMVILTAVNVWLIFKDFFPANKVAGVICTVINTATFFSLIGLPIFNFHTDTIGIYFTSIILLIVYKDKRKTLLLALLSVLLIFTKQILVVMVVPLFFYYLIMDRKLALKFFLQCAVCGLVIFVIVQLLFPLYWTETIYAQFFVSRNYGNLYSAIINICSLYYRYNMYIILILIGTIGGIYLKSKSGYEFTIPFFTRDLIKNEEYAIYLILNMIFGTIFLLYFAKCGGDGYKYCQDIIAPSFYVLAVYVWYRYFGGILFRNSGWNLRKRSVLVLLLCFTTTITYTHFGRTYYSRDDIKNYVELDSIIESHSGEKMYLGMNSTQYMLNRNIWESEDIWFNDGQIEYFNQTYPDIALLNKFFYNEEIENAAKSYVAEVNTMIQNKEFGLITTCSDNIVDGSLLEQNYYNSGTIGIKTDVNGIFEVTVWLPKV